MVGACGEYGIVSGAWTVVDTSSGSVMVCADDSESSDTGGHGP